ncbi:MAG: formate dehydrogenase subunit alpha [Candidatus Rokubacteria bacterium]|nr:formate dehydrogenase subunit alpha [Candidatus Rokubacteria bacterium]
MIVNGRAVTPAAGWSILDAARAAGVAIPTLCHHPALPADGSCRLCVVEIDGRPGLRPACVEPAADELHVTTDTPAAHAARRHALALLLRGYRPPPGTRDNELHRLARAHGLSADGAGPSRERPVDDSNPFVRFDPAACVHCWRCVRACDRLNGVAAIGVFGRGADAHVGFGLDQPMGASTCESCGMCAAVCPTGALGVKTVAAAPDARAATTVCSYCGVGCRLEVRVEDGRVVGTEPAWRAPANHGLLCVKGRFGWPYLHHRDRLTRPLVRCSLIGGVGDALVETDWDTALDLVARRLAATAERHGADSIGFLASAKCSNEENYLVQKLARQLVGTHNVDHCARLCHAPTVAALGAALGSGAMTNAMDDIVRDARAVLVVGSNTTEQHPVLGMRLRRAVHERGVPIVVVDPRAIPLTRVAALHLRLRPGTDAALLNALAHVLIAEDRVDRAFVAARTEGYEAFAASVREATPERAQAVTGVPADDIRRAARLLADHRPGALLYAMGVTQHTGGTANAHACVNLQLLLGNFGVPGAGVNPLRGQNNVQGACDVGALPDLLPGYQPVHDAAARARFESAWGTRLPAAPGLTVTEQLDAAHTGRVRALWILGENAAVTEPDLAHARRCLAACEFLVVQEIFPTETAAYAHVVLPAAASAEKAGTFTSTERRVQRFEPVVSPPGDARPDWWIVAEVARRVARVRPAADRSAPHAAWAYRGPADVMDEIAALAPIYAGISHARLGDTGLQWPCRSADDPGTSILHVGRFSRGRARFVPAAETRPAEAPDDAYPLTLTTGRVLAQYHAGSMSRRVAGLHALAPEAIVEMHPADAAPRGIATGDRVRVTSRRGSVAARVRLTPGIAHGTVFLPFHFAEAAANELTIGAVDPVAKIPEYKVCAVTLERAGVSHAEARGARLDHQADGRA